MKTTLFISSVLCGAFLTGCVYDDNYPVRGSVSVSTGTPDYYGEYDEYSPHYSYSGRRYYRADNRYVYYANRRPYYVASLPSRAVYVNPPRHTTVNRVVRHHRYDHDD